ncbi:dihydroorotase [Marinoscillum sp.]|uniref:dihydroorotase n=1 Tax=Marinoscillum sp. TaxID=2024838 RepID=UPI003BAA6463
MKVLLKKSTILDPSSEYHGQTIDVYIENGIIEKIDSNIKKSADYTFENLSLSPGFFDLNAHFNEPGGEHKEDLKSGSKCALFSGFTDVCVLPNTEPVIESKSDVRYIQQGHAEEGINLWAIGAVSEGCKGENLSEILDLQNAGAVAFSDGLNPIWNTELLLKSLQYVQKFDGLVITRPKDVHLSQFAQMHEGKASTILGMNGEPSLSEEIAIKRDLEILRYAGGRLHFSLISTAEGISLINKAKKDGLLVTCDVAIHQLFYTEDDLTDYNSNFKVDPPFRSEKDRKALIRGVQTGVIDAIVSAHNPQDPESKDLEFDLATPGICSLPTFYSDLIKLSSQIDIGVLIDRVTKGPRRILQMNPVIIEEGAQAKLALFAPEEKWTFDMSTNPSKSVNSPQYGEEITGKCIGVINGDVIRKN